MRTGPNGVLLAVGFWVLTLWALALCSCAVRMGNLHADGSSSYMAANVGITEKEVMQSAESYAAAEVDGEKSFRHARIAAQTASIGANLAKLGETVRRGYSAAQVTQRGATAAQAATKQAEIAAGVEKARILNPVP